MGCCLGVLLLAGAPRIALLVWWLADPARVTGVFSTWLWPALGFLLLPWTTVAYVFVAPGGVSGLDWLILVIGLLLDLGAHGGGGREYTRRRALA